MKPKLYYEPYLISVVCIRDYHDCFGLSGPGCCGNRDHQSYSRKLFARLAYEPPWRMQISFNS